MFVHWDIQVDDGVKMPSVEYSPPTGVVIRANRLDTALALVSRGRELAEKYPDNTPEAAWEEWCNEVL